ncbi:MAG: PHP domain-containing protein [Methanobacteriota archaeon]|nr:MAG: PHP domain-containing protein [Euryarchaeota archaeon]
MVGKADLHTHTKYSGMSKIRFMRFPDAVSEPADVVRAAERRGLDVVCVTDHDTTEGALKAARVRADVEVVVGEEVSSAGGEILGLFVTEAIPRGLSPEETIDRIHEMGGVAVAPHPFSSHCSSVEERLFELKLDAVEMFNAFHRDGYANDLAQRICRHLPVARTGGSDAHAPMMVGDGYTTFDGATGEELRKALLNRETSYGGESTTFRDFVWLTTLITASLQRTLVASLVGSGVPDDTMCTKEIFAARRISRVLGLLGTIVFLAPPVAFTASVIGDRLHKSRSKVRWKELAEPFGGARS